MGAVQPLSAAVGWSLVPAGHPRARPPRDGSAFMAGDSTGAGGAGRVDRILWIDDEVRSDDGSVRLLELDGFRAECAGTGAAGLRLALTREYDGIVLDLRLPDLDGLAVLERMVAAGVTARVVVLSWWADAESAVAAMKLGAVDVQDKPLFGDGLTGAVRALLASGRQRPRPGPTGAPPRPASLPLLAAPALHDAAHALTDPALSPLEFIALARAFRRALGPAALKEREAEGSKEREASAERLLHRRSWDPNVAQAIVEHIERDLSSGRLPSEAEIASHVGIDPLDVGAVVKAACGSDYAGLRRALRVRPAVREVAYSTEQIAQIAYHHGYEHAGQFNRDFRKTFGVTPRRFRRLVVRRFGADQTSC